MFINDCLTTEVNLDDAMAETDSNSDLDWMGHVLGDVWQVSFNTLFLKGLFNKILFCTNVYYIVSIKSV